MPEPVSSPACIEANHGGSHDGRRRNDHLNSTVSALAPWRIHGGTRRALAFGNALRRAVEYRNSTWDARQQWRAGLAELANADGQPSGPGTRAASHYGRRKACSSILHLEHSVPTSNPARIASSGVFVERLNGALLRQSQRRGPSLSPLVLDATVEADQNSAVDGRAAVPPMPSQGAHRPCHGLRPHRAPQG